MRKEILGLCTIFLIIILGSLLFYRGEKEAWVELVANRSTYNSRPTGCKAFYLLLEEMGFDIERWQLPVKELASALPERTLFVTIDPQPIFSSRAGGFSVSSGAENVLSWVREGGKLLVIDDSNNQLIKALKMEIESSEEIWEAQEKILTPLLPTSYIRNAKTIKTKGDAHLEKPVGGEIAHLKCKDKPVLISKALDKGWVTVLSAPYIVSNEGIDEEDNCILLTNIIAKEGYGRKILFDEYHHGYDSSLSLFGYYRQKPITWAFLQLALLTVALFYSLGRRFGKAHPLQMEEKRSILKYVKSMASLYHRTGLQSSVLRNIYLRYKNQWIRKFGLRSNVDLWELCSLVSVRAGLKREKLFSTLSDCERICRNEEKLDKGGFFNLVRDLEIYRRQIHGKG